MWPEAFPSLGWFLCFRCRAKASGSLNTAVGICPLISVKKHGLESSLEACLPRGFPAICVDTTWALWCLRVLSISSKHFANGYLTSARLWRSYHPSHVCPRHMWTSVLALLHSRASGWGVLDPWFSTLMSLQLGIDSILLWKAILSLWDVRPLPTRCQQHLSPWVLTTKMSQEVASVPLGVNHL